MVTKTSNYSYLSASTGFLVAALQLIQLTVNKAIPRASNPAKANNHQLSSVLYAKFSSHLCMANQAMGVAMINAIAIQLTKLLFSIVNISDIMAPLIFLIPISLTRCCMLKAAIAKIPSEERMIEIIVNSDSAWVWAYSPAYTFR